MKNKIYATLLTLFAITAFVACSSDNDGGASNSVSYPIIIDNEGNAYQVLSVGNIRFGYDENGKLSSFKEKYGDTYYIDGESFTFDYDDAILKVSLNGNGFISKAQMTADYKYPSGSYEKGSITISFNYNSEKQLVSASYSGSSEWNFIEDEAKGSGNMSGTLKNTWSKGNLIQSIQEEDWKETENGKKDVDHSLATYTYEYGNQANPLKQFPYFVGHNSTVIFEVGMDIFCLIGMYGVGPEYFPTSYTENIIEECERYGDVETYNNTYYLSFTLNNNGTIKTESDRRDVLTYTYRDFQTSRAAYEQVESILPSLKDQMQKMIKRRHKNNI